MPQLRRFLGECSSHFSHAATPALRGFLASREVEGPAECSFFAWSRDR